MSGTGPYFFTSKEKADGSSRNPFDSRLLPKPLRLRLRRRRRRDAAEAAGEGLLRADPRRPAGLPLRRRLLLVGGGQGPLQERLPRLRRRGRPVGAGPRGLRGVQGGGDHAAGRWMPQDRRGDEGDCLQDPRHRAPAGAADQAHPRHGPRHRPGSVQGGEPEKLIGDLGGFFSKKWKPKKNGTISGPMLAGDDSFARKGSHLEQRQKLGLTDRPRRSNARDFLSEPTSGLEKVKVEKAKQDDALSDLSDILTELKGMAIDMGSEIDRQTGDLGHAEKDFDELNFRVKGANAQTHRLLGR